MLDQEVVLPETVCESSSLLERQQLSDACVQKNFTLAEDLARALIRRFPRDLFAWKMLAAVFSELGKLEETLVISQHLLQLAPEDWQVCNNCANTLKQLRRLQEAAPLYEKAISLNTVALEPRYNYGLLLLDLGRLAEAEYALLDALILKPNHGYARLNLGNLYNVQGRYQESEQQYLIALQSLPEMVPLHNNLALCMRRMHRYQEAERYFRRTLELDPDYPTALSNFAEFLALHGCMDEAIALLRRAVELDPSETAPWSNLLFMLSHTKASPEEVFAEHRAYGRHIHRQYAKKRLPAYLPEPGDRLRIGIVSADLRDHPVMRYLRPALRCFALDPAVEVTAYSNQQNHDADTMRYRQEFSAWREVSHLSEDALARQIRADGIEILIDLSGHSGRNRLPAFAMKPAPLQVSWMGYVGTTGLEEIDYFIADSYLVPAEMESQFVERILRVPVTTVFEPCVDSPAVGELPCLQSGVFTFACLARATKQNREQIAAWAKILNEAPHARLMLTTMADGCPPVRVLEWCALEGIATERVLFVNPRSTEETLALHQQIDLALDSFPYNGSTSNNHAAWMGVPTLTFPGSAPTGRMTTALNRHLGLEEFIADGEQGYIDAAIAWSRRLDDLAVVRRDLRARCRESLLFRPEEATAALLRVLRAALEEKRSRIAAELA